MADMRAPEGSVVARMSAATSGTVSKPAYRCAIERIDTLNDVG
jgi:hypothetical protein